MPDSSSDSPKNRRLVPHAEELLWQKDKELACETYIFEPAPGEEAFGHFFAAAKTHSDGDFGRELLDAIVTAIQKEYYRDPKRKPAASFEMALHQANLILHDMAEQGVRDWMQTLDVAVGVLANNALHLSVAGGGQVLLVRGGTVSDVSMDLSEKPVTNPLQSFSEVAVGEVMEDDMLIFTTAEFVETFSSSIILRGGREQDITKVAHDMRTWYTGEGLHVSLPAVVAHVHGKAAAAVAAAPVQYTRQRDEAGAVAKESIKPRNPIIIRKPKLKQYALFVKDLVMAGGRNVMDVVLRRRRFEDEPEEEYADEPEDTRAQRHTERLPFYQRVILFFLNGPRRIRSTFRRLPLTSKVFAVLSLLLLAALGSSLFLLQQKRTSDADIEQASKILHEARLKKDAAQTALIYDNREQANTFLNEARGLADELGQTGIYQEEQQQLLAEIQEEQDRLQRITRVTDTNSRLVGDFGELLAQGAAAHLFAFEDSLYSYNRKTNGIVRMSLDGQTTTLLEETQNIGFFKDAAAHISDKMITFLTDTGGVALYDVRDNSMVAQDIELPEEAATVTDIAMFGNRLYIIDGSANTILTYNKTLRGYGSGSEWLADDAQAPADMRSLAVDGDIYALQEDGSIQRFFKGAPADFTLDSVTPSLAGAEQIYTSDELSYLYVLDPAHKRVIVYTKQGALVQQLMLPGEDDRLVDIAVPAAEEVVYVLNGSQVLEVKLQTGI